MQRLQYDLRFSAAKRNGIPHAAAAARNLDAAIPLRSEQIELQNTNAQRQPLETKSHLETSVTLRSQIETDSTQRRRRLTPSRTRGNFSPATVLRNATSVYTRKKHIFFVQTLTFASLPVAVPMRSAKSNSQNTIQSQDITGEPVPFETP